ncbi:UDP-N-acetylmuramoyl-L-alanyl-D-glutamate--2,6-diaminopimelate ligase [Phaeodactylibacter sp.]|jgi:UDP-N-acetylmuramoyl-L-alanyl-D-glutamate--2,6-diaminopimelate ligase|uniref:UDP-N-acetylmuramoyl-L-alanyl-D-glutamate--2, 6-diaminopimelate ligase n=1 Tax=Phaeodactylibacter sp. TaxID=1940289 RepID=UPI0025DEB203|nr:UDP-N-acetylmuramoyl-L-alanyl-D-glutamate--2,6-diaminopimelate ligase [Phaeodactylibacter sp.]MCI4648317.1 UDP-N-acetylmuramoyl-L-alanyl-D-glutamate--2,6-diaminopimelate ligase [Phaeodactylibacter sp.]MCI5090414.1 UDP-N-acetylmuramoyl-L-alanyl-D-glutamate--2,6-diaminopimelate ligase [Phaeodactylibacter sp.]
MSTTLETLLEPVKVLAANGPLGQEVESLQFDSRKVKRGDVFIAIRGTQVDGHDYIASAVEKGATAIIAETLPETLPDHLASVQVADSAKALGEMASLFYGEPSKQLKLVGVTGTNGKTTTVTLLHELFLKLGYKAGLLSTVRNKIGETPLPATHTTPDALSVQALLREMVDAGCDYAFMEVSSHAAHQRRIAGLNFDGAVFTNITHDHLDYHKTFKAYIEAKKMFFDMLPDTAFALVNIDDRRGEVMLQNTLAKRYTYSLRSMANFRAKLLDNSVTGLQLLMDEQEVFSRLIGDFNAYNLLAVYSVAVLLGQDRMETLTALSELGAVDGRFETIVTPGKSYIGIVDYAHTPDALEKVLQTIDQLRQRDSRVITVVGCGGDRDKTKRPVMAKTACALSDQVILTSDNPRSEDPEAILEDMWKGVPKDATRKVLTIVNRREAIRTAAALAQGTDIVLIAGKGHEKYQEINGERLPFDDKAELEGALQDKS